MILIGNPENRRVMLFQEALARAGQAPARVLPWRDLARGPDDVEAAFAELPEEPAPVRIDSFGEDFELDRQLLLRGLDDVSAHPGIWTADAAELATLAYDHGRIFAPRQHHLGFLRVLRDVDHALARRPWLEVLNVPESIERLFDKRACARTFAAAGVPFPQPLPEARTPEELRESMRETGILRVFVKLTCGSSASCLALYDLAEGWLFTSMEIEADRFYNSLRPRRYRDSAAIDHVLAFLLREGSHVEEHVPKARLGGRFFDTRMLTIDGEVAFTIVRKSPHPVTNLHLGGARGTLEELEAAIPRDVIEAAHESCRRVFAAHACLHVGIDVMFTAGFDGHRVLEANAFGDLFPGLPVYDREIASLRGIRSRTFAP